MTDLTTPNSSNLSFARSDLSKLAADCNKILEKRAKITEKLKKSSQKSSNTSKNSESEKKPVPRPRPLKNSNSHYNIVHNLDKEKFAKQFGGNFSEINSVTSGSQSYGLPTPRDHSSQKSSQVTSPRENSDENQENSDPSIPTTNITVNAEDLIMNGKLASKLLTKNNIPDVQYKIEMANEKSRSSETRCSRTSRALSNISEVEKENASLRTENCNFRLKCAEWESKATVLAENLADMQKELMTKTTDMMELKNIIVVRDNEFNLKLQNLRDKHQTDLNKLTEQAQTVDDKNLILASQIKMLEEDLISQTGKGLGVNPSGNPLNSDIIQSHKNILENLKSHFNQEKSKLKQDLIGQKEKYELTKIKAAQLDSDFEREKNDNRAKNRELKKLRYELDVTSRNKKELEYFAKSETQKLSARIVDLENTLSKVNEEYNHKIESLTDEFEKVYDIKNKLQNENNSLMEQISVDTKTYKNAKNMKVALALVNKQKNKLLEEKKRMKSQLAELKKKNDKISNNVGSEISDLVKEKNNLAKKIVARDSKINGYDAKLNEHINEIENLHAKIHERESELEKVSEAKTKLVKKLTTLEEQLNTIMTDQQTSVRTITEEKHKMMTENNTLKDALRRISSHTADFKSERKVLCNELESYKKNYKTMEMTNINLTKKVSELQVKALQNDDENSNWKSVFESSQAENNKLQEEISQLKESQFQFESKNLDLLHEKKRVRSFEKQLLAKNAEIAKLKSQVMFQKNTMERESTSSDYQSQKNLKMAHELTLRQARDLIKNNKDLRGEVDRLSMELKAVSEANGSIGGAMSHMTSSVVSQPISVKFSENQLNSDQESVNTAQSITDLYNRYNNLESQFLKRPVQNCEDNPENPLFDDHNSSTSNSTRAVLGPILDNNSNNNNNQNNNHNNKTHIETTYHHNSILNYSPPPPVEFSETSYKKTFTDLKFPEKSQTTENENTITNVFTAEHSHEEHGNSNSKTMIHSSSELETVSKTSLEFARKLEALAKERSEES